MNKKNFYEPPTSEVIELEKELFLCTSTGVNAIGSEEKDFDPEQEIDGGEYEFE